eukprot:3880160-Rhodomonas_salina.1
MGIVLRACYAMPDACRQYCCRTAGVCRYAVPGTEIGYAATRRVRREVRAEVASPYRATGLVCAVRY